MADKSMVNVMFNPLGRAATVPEGSLIADAMLAAGVLLPLDCGGKGTCGRCLVQVKGLASPPNQAEKRLIAKTRLERGFRLACQTRILGDLNVSVPETAETCDSSWPMDMGELDSVKINDPVITALDITIPCPSLEDPRADLRRVLEAVTPQNSRKGQVELKADLPTAAQITCVSREKSWNIRAYKRGAEIIGVAQTGDDALGVAVDLGSTKIAAYLVNLENGEILKSKGRINPQAAFGADVVTRLQRAMADPQDKLRLTSLIRRALDDLIRDLCSSVGAETSRVVEMSLVGNTAMTHLLLGLPVKQLGAPPFVASMDQAIDLKAREIELDLAPGAYLHLPPLIGGFVGSDNVAMIMGSDLDLPGPCRLGLDIGTNTEVVLTAPYNEHPLFVASAPSGPTFEGAHLSSGMRAMAGAVSQVRLDRGRLLCRTIDGGKPAGICGSGIIDAVAEMARGGIINQQGHLDRSLPQVQVDDHSIRYVLVPSDQSATGKDIVVTQADISQVQLAKGAINAAAKTLLTLAGLEISNISEIVLAGSFGSNFDVKNARFIGLIPDAPGALYRQVGNAAGKGARHVLNNQAARLRAAAIPPKARYLELASEPLFNKLFARSLAFPKSQGCFYGN